MKQAGILVVGIAAASVTMSAIVPSHCLAQTTFAPTAFAPTTFAQATPAKAPAAPSVEEARAIAARTVSLIVEKQRRGYDLCFVVRTTIETDLAAWRVAAGADDTNGQLALGLCNYYGIGGSRNRTRGMELIRKAASDRNAEAMAVLSILYRNGDAQNAPDLVEATRWLEQGVAAKGKIALHLAPIEKAKAHFINGEHKLAHAVLNLAAERSILDAKFRLGKSIRIGWACELETDRGTQLIKEAAEGGHVGAMLEMADTYRNGRFAKPDKNSWKKWLEAAAATGDAQGVLRAADEYESASNEDRAAGVRSRALVESMQKFDDPYTMFHLATKVSSEIVGRDPKRDTLVFDRWIDAAERGVPQAYLWANTAFFEGTPKHPKDLDRARVLLEHGVAACEPDAIHQMGCAYRFGYFEPADEKRSIEFFQIAASMGCPAAMSSIGLRYSEGRGLPFDPELGFHCYYAGARAGAPDSMASLATFFCNGTFIEANYDECLFWSTQAIRYGQIDTYNTLANLHFRGVGRAPDPERAINLLRDGSKYGSTLCKMRLGERLILGDGLSKDVKSGVVLIEQCLQNDAFGDARVTLGRYLLGLDGVPAEPARAIKLLEEAAGLGNARGHYLLAWVFAKGHGDIAKNWDRARKHYEQAILLGDTDSMNELAWHYLDGKLTPRDPKKAEALFLEGVARGQEYAMRLLISFYLGQFGDELRDLDKAFKAARLFAEQGRYAPCHTIGSYCYEQQDYDAAREWYELGATGNDAMCINGLGVLYRHGKGVEQNYEKAVEYYKRAADQKNVSAYMNLSWCYETGNGVKQDLGEAFRLCGKAASAGVPDAMLMLGKKYMDGIGIARSTEMGFFWIEKAANAGNETAKAVVLAAKEKGLIK